MQYSTPVSYVEMEGVQEPIPYFAESLDEHACRIVRLGKILFVASNFPSKDDDPLSPERSSLSLHLLLSDPSWNQELAECETA